MQHDNGDVTQTSVQVPVTLRVFAYLLLNTALQSSSKRSRDPEQQIRVFRTAIKACRLCLETEEFELAQKVLETCAEHASAAEREAPIAQISNGDEAEKERCQITRSLMCEYYLMRLTHAWKSGRFDLADHFYTKLDSRHIAVSASLAEQAADLFHEAAKLLLGQKLLEPAIKWCDRALRSLDAYDLEELSHESPELRLAVTATLVEALLLSGNNTFVSRASDLVDQLESEHGLSNRVAVSLMRFRVVSATKPVDGARIGDVLARIIRIAVLTDGSFRT